MSNTETLMGRAIYLAGRSLGQTSPKPMVGAVIVREGRIIGEGRENPLEQDAAEIQAINAVGGDCRNAHLYTSLEPDDQRTAQAIIDAGIGQVSFAAARFPDGRGSEARHMLEDAGITLHRGPLEREARFLNRAWFHQQKTGRPWVTVKYAMSLDGRIATVAGQTQWITAPETREQAHELRQVTDAILVGRGTAVRENPRLTTRLQGRECLHPIRVLLDSKGRTPAAVKLFDPNLPGQTLLACTRAIPEFVQKTLEAQGVTIMAYPADRNGRVPLDTLMRDLTKKGVTTVMVDGGGELLGSFFAQDMINEVWAFVGARLLGGEKAPGPIAGQGIRSLGLAPRLDIYESRALGPDILIKALVRTPA